MLRWWNKEDNVLNGDSQEVVKEQQYDKESEEGPLREWQFRVSASTSPGEIVCVTGGSFTLGQWDSERVLPLTREG